MQIVSTGLLYGRYKGLPSMNNIFTRMSFFSSLFLWFSLHTFFMGLRELAWTPKDFLFCAFTCLSNNSLISSWISAKLGSALPPYLLYLSYCFQPKENTWMCLWKVITLQVNFCHNLDPRKMICINFQFHNLYWCIILFWNIKNCRLEFIKTKL